MAKRCGVDGEQLLIEVAAQAGHVVEAVYKELSSGFPVAVVEPVFEGLTNAATRLA